MSSRKTLKVVPLFIGVGLAICAGVWWFTRSGASTTSPAEAKSETDLHVSASAPPTLEYVPMAIGAPVDEVQRPWVTHLDIVDLDQDGLPDVLYCDAQQNTIRWIRQDPKGVFTESIIGEDIPGPAHVAVGDVNGTGRNDVLVASMGRVLPTNDRIGAVVVLENLDNRRFQKHVLIDQVARVTDVRAANLSDHRDGRLDLVVGQFGYNQGETRIMKNLGGWKFESHIVNSQSGCIHTPVADFDRDGKVDFIALISQEWEEIHFFRNRGFGAFEDRVVWGSNNEDYGSSGMASADVNMDGLQDLIYTNGDGFDYAGPGTRKRHGMQWLENRGNGIFKFQRVGGLGGAFAPCAGDLDSDGDIDLFAVSAFGDDSQPDNPSMMAWLNDGRQNFTPVVIARKPIHLLAAAVGDLDRDGVPEIVTGGMHIFPPYEDMSNITLWRRK